MDLAGLEVNHQLLRRIRLDRGHQGLHIVGRYPQAGQAHGDAVAIEDLGKRLTYKSVDAPTLQRLRRVLTRRTTTEIGVSQKNRCPLVTFLVEGMTSLRTIVLKDVLAEILEGHRAQIARRDDPVGVDITTTHHHRAARYIRNHT